MATPRSTSNERFLAFMVWPVNRGVLPKTRHRANPRKYGEASAPFPRGGRGPSIGDGLGKGFSSDHRYLCKWLSTGSELTPYLVLCFQ